LAVPTCRRAKAAWEAYYAAQLEEMKRVGTDIHGFLLPGGSLPAAARRSLPSWLRLACGMLSLLHAHCLGPVGCAACASADPPALALCVPCLGACPFTTIHSHVHCVILMQEKPGLRLMQYKSMVSDQQGCIELHAAALLRDVCCCLAEDGISKLQQCASALLIDALQIFEKWQKAPQNPRNQVPK